MDENTSNTNDLFPNNATSTERDQQALLLSVTDLEINVPPPDEPPIRVMALHALLYCERLFYLEEVESLKFLC